MSIDPILIVVAAAAVPIYVIAIMHAGAIDKLRDRVKALEAKQDKPQ